jgi:hypothetical protein
VLNWREIDAAKVEAGMDQSIINWALGILGTLGGFLLNALWQSVKDLQVADKELADKVASVDKVVAGDYITRTELDTKLNDFFGRLDRQLARIEDKIDKKADK